jgi:small subunit ribosomal protein S6e
MPILIISDPETGLSQRVELEDSGLSPLLGQKIGDIIDGAIANLQGYKIRLTGGTDKDGIPMRPDVHGSAKADLLISGGVGYKPAKKGERKRMLVRGNTVSNETTFLNFSIVEKPRRRRRRRSEDQESEPSSESKGVSEENPETPEN